MAPGYAPTTHFPVCNNLMSFENPATDKDAAILDLLPVGAMVVDSDLKIVRWNRTLVEWTGIPVADAEGTTLTRQFGNLSNSYYERRLKELFVHGTPVVFSAALHRHFLPIRPRHGLSLGMMVQQAEARLLPERRDHALITIQDVSLQYLHITQLKQERAQLVATQSRMAEAVDQLEVSNMELRVAEQTLRESREYTENILASMIDMLVIVERDGTISRVNPATCDVLGYREDELVGQHVRMLFARQQDESPANTYPMEWRLVGSLFGERQAGDIEGWCHKKNGTKIDVSFSGARMRGADGELQAAVCVLKDITERNQLQADLMRSQKLESLGQLAAGVAHEINTPMQCVATNLEYLEGTIGHLMAVVDACVEMLNGPPEAWQSRLDALSQQLDKHDVANVRNETPEAIRDTATSVRRVIEIVRSMRAMSHPGTRDYAPTDLNQLIRDAVTISANRWKSVADVHLELDDNLPHPNALPAEVMQLVLNLLINAGDAVTEKHHAGDDEGPDSIWVRTMANDLYIVLEIEDTGVGIPRSGPRTNLRTVLYHQASRQR